MQYLGIVTQEEDALLIEFPDCPGCQTFTRDPSALVAVAQEALEVWLESELAAGDVPLRPSAGFEVPDTGRLQAVGISATLGARLALRWLREDLGLSQAELARRVGVSRQAIQQLEHPDANLSLKTLERVARAVGRSVEIALV